MPDELAVFEGCGGGHHAVDPFRGEEGLVYVGGAVVPFDRKMSAGFPVSHALINLLPCTIHVQVIAPLQRNRARTSDFFVSNSTSEGDLAGHGGAADDGLVEAEFLDESGDAADVGVLVVCVFAGPVAGRYVSERG